MRNKIKAHLNRIGGVLGAIAWRAFGLFLFILGASAGTGAVFVGDWLLGVIVAFATLMLGLISALGYAIAVRGEVTQEDVAKAAQDAVQRANEKK